MFSLDNFYKILYANFCKDQNFSMFYFLNFNLENSDAIEISSGPEGKTTLKSPQIIFYDQEPLHPFVFVSLILQDVQSLTSFKYPKILANSEHSDIKNNIIKEYKFVDWYYFFHGFAALEWYRDFKYYPKVETQFSKVFISLNHLTTKDRSYRLNLVANLKAENLLDHGHVSLHCSKQALKTEIFNKGSRLSLESKKFIIQNLTPLNLPLVLDTKLPYGELSSKLNLKLESSALWNVVSETVYYDQRLHLTEKIFKPIVARRPFILVAAPGNLAYLKSYGFRTFDRWIDESYDFEPDPDLRIKLVTKELKKLCLLTFEQLQEMHQEMQEILDYNFNHFYNGFKELVVSELVDNFESACLQINNGRSYHNPSPYHQRLDYPKNFFKEAKQRLSQ